MNVLSINIADFFYSCWLIMDLNEIDLRNLKCVGDFHD